MLALLGLQSCRRLSNSKLLNLESEIIRRVPLRQGEMRDRVNYNIGQRQEALRHLACAVAIALGG